MQQPKAHSLFSQGLTSLAVLLSVLCVAACSSTSKNGSDIVVVIDTIYPYLRQAYVNNAPFAVSRQEYAVLGSLSNKNFEQEVCGIKLKLANNGSRSYLLSEGSLYEALFHGLELEDEHGALREFEDLIRHGERSAPPCNMPCVAGTERWMVATIGSFHIVPAQRSGAPSSEIPRRVYYKLKKQVTVSAKQIVDGRLLAPEEVAIGSEGRCRISDHVAGD